MKRPCPMCKKIVDDGLSCPPNTDPELMKKSHKVCKHCLPDFKRYAAEEMRKLAARKMLGGEI